MNDFDLCMSGLLSLEGMSFRFRPKTEEPFTIAVGVVASFKKLLPEERLRVLDSIGFSGWKKLLALSSLLAEAAINRNNPQYVEAAVGLHVIEGYRWDERENIRRLVLIAYAAKRIGIDISAVITSMLAIASAHAAKGLSDFLSRGEDVNRLAQYGIRSELNNGVFRFVPA
jgi:hypothetical protein